MGIFIPKEYYKGYAFKRELYEWIETIFFTVVTGLILFTFIARGAIVDGTSMVPTLQNSDILIVSRLNYKPKYGDVVVIKRPGEKPLVKRLIAMGGQTVDIDFVDGIVYVDGIALDENYINEKPFTRRDDFVGPIVVPEGEVFVMGDNRMYSSDSRDRRISTIDEDYLMGRVVFRVFPFNHMGVIK